MSLENEDLEKWLQSQSSPNLEVAPTQAPQQSSGAWDRARQLMEKQSAMQYSAPERFSKPVTAEAAPESNEWKTVLAMALNVLGNKGKDIGQIAMSATDQRNKQLQQWRNDNGPRALAEREMQMAQLRNADRQGFDAERKMLGDQVGQELQVAGAEQGQANADRQFTQSEDHHLDAQAERMGDNIRQEGQFEATQGLTREQMAQSRALQEAQMRQSAGQAAASRAQAEAHFKASQEQHWLDQDNQLNRDRDGYAHDIEKQAARAQTEKDIHDLTHPTPVAPPGYRIKKGQEQNFLQSMSNKKLESDLSAKVGNAKQIEATLGEIARLRKAPSSASNKQLYDAAIKSLIGDRSQEGSTGVLSGTEFERYLKDLPEYGATADLGTWRGIRDKAMGRNPALETIQGMQKRYRQTHAADLTPYGLEYADATEEQPLDVKRYSNLKLVQ